MKLSTELHGVIAQDPGERVRHLIHIVHLNQLVGGCAGGVSIEVEVLHALSLGIESDDAGSAIGILEALRSQAYAKAPYRLTEIQGVGFKAAVQGKNVNLALGYSHPINYPIPDQIKVTVEENTKVIIEGPDKAEVGRVAAEIRSYYPPEPYKGKGVRYAGEKVVRKEGKTVQ